MLPKSISLWSIIKYLKLETSQPTQFIITFQSNQCSINFIFNIKLHYIPFLSQFIIHHPLLCIFALCLHNLYPLPCLGIVVPRREVRGAQHGAPPCICGLNLKVLFDMNPDRLYAQHRNRMHVRIETTAHYLSRRAHGIIRHAKALQELLPSAP